jgi:hypothetical protein
LKAFVTRLVTTGEEKRVLTRLDDKVCMAAARVTRQDVDCFETIGQDYRSFDVPTNAKEKVRD